MVVESIHQLALLLVLPLHGQIAFDRPGDSDPNIGNFNTRVKHDQLFEKNYEFFKSVHLCGDGLEKELKEAKRQELEKWKSKILVDSIYMHVRKEEEAHCL